MERRITDGKYHYNDLVLKLYMLLVQKYMVMLLKCVNKTSLSISQLLGITQQTIGNWMAYPPRTLMSRSAFISFLSVMDYEVNNNFFSYNIQTLLEIILFDPKIYKKYRENLDKYMTYLRKHTKLTTQGANDFMLPSLCEKRTIPVPEILKGIGYTDEEQEKDNIHTGYPEIDAAWNNGPKIDFDNLSSMFKYPGIASIEAEDDKLSERTENLYHDESGSPYWMTAIVETKAANENLDADVESIVLRWKSLSREEKESKKEWCEQSLDEAIDQLLEALDEAEQSGRVR